MSSQISHSFDNPGIQQSTGERPPPILEVLRSMPLRPAPAPSQISHSFGNKQVAKPWMRTEIYSSGGEKYARFRWGSGRQSFGYAHINGGSSSTKLVQRRRKEVDEAIARGDELQQILDLIRPWGQAKRGRKPF